MAESTPALQSRLASEHCEVVEIAAIAGSGEDIEQTIALARKEQAEWIVVDGYRFTSDYQRALKTAGCKILFLDDYGHAGHYSADLVLNQNVGANEVLYASRESYTRLLLGPRYALLRREFTRWRDWKRELAPRCRRLLVMMGGSDPENISARVVLALQGFRDLEVTMVVGGSNPHFPELTQLLARSGQKITVREDVTNMPELMAEADLAVSAAGSTTWELCLMGLPAILIDVAPNQTALAKELDRTGCAVHVGDRTVSQSTIAEQLGRVLDSGELLRSLSEHARCLVDGLGANRAISLLRGDDENGRGLQLRPARADDSKLLWEWANDVQVRSSSFSSSPVPWESHSKWFAAKLAENSTFIWIAENEQGVRCGQIRFDARPDGSWETDVSIAKEMRGQGLASRLISLGAERLQTEHHNAKIHAYVKAENSASLKAFERASFKRIGIARVSGGEAIHLVYALKGQAKS